MKRRMFRIMGGEDIPWALIELHEKQALRNHSGQSLERLSERGGLAPNEALAVLEDRRVEFDSGSAYRLRAIVKDRWYIPRLEEVERELKIANARIEILEEMTTVYRGM